MILRILGLAIALLGLTACASGPPTAPEYPWPAATSADGKYRLQIRHVEWTNWPGKEGGPGLTVQTGLEPMPPDLLVAFARIPLEVVTSDGARRDEERVWSDVDSAHGGIIARDLDVGAEGSRLALLAFDVPLLHVRKWTEHEFPGIEGPGTRELSAPPFPLHVTPEPKMLWVSASGGDHGFLVHDWAAGSVDVVDARGARLDPQGGGGDGGATACGYGRWPSEGQEAPDIAYPVTVRLLVPKSWDTETVRFEFRDLALPPRPVTVPAMIGPAPGQDPWPTTFTGGREWSAWSAPVAGLSSRLNLPKRLPRGERVIAGLRLRFEASGLPAGVTHFDSWDIDRGVRLLFRDSETGKQIEIPAVDPHEGPPRSRRDMDYEGESQDPYCAPIREGALRMLRGRFPLASAWHDVVPGKWEVRIAVEVKEHPHDPPPHPEGTPAPVVWTGSFTTEPLAVVVEEALPRRIRYLVPKRLRLVPTPGIQSGVGIGCLEEDREAVDLEARNGFTLGIDVRRSDGIGGHSSGGLPDFAIADGIPQEHEGPFSGDYEIVLFETGEEFRYHVDYDPRHPTCRVLWRRSFRVEATAEEIRAMREASSGAPPAPR